MGTGIVLLGNSTFDVVDLTTKHPEMNHVPAEQFTREQINWSNETINAFDHHNKELVLDGNTILVVEKPQEIIDAYRMQDLHNDYILNERKRLAPQTREFSERVTLDLFKLLGGTVLILWGWTFSRIYQKPQKEN